MLTNWQIIFVIEKISFGVEKLSRYGKAATKKDAKSQAAAAAYLSLCPHIAPQVDTSIAVVEVLYIYLYIIFHANEN